MNINIYTVQAKICPYCLGSGKRKAMQSAISRKWTSIRWEDTEQDCQYCKGTGVK